jgi:hypothetical protein
MIKNSSTVALVVAVIAICGTFVLGTMSPVSANTAYPTSAGYFPDQFVNQAKEIEPAIDTHGDTGLPKVFPKEPVDSLIDAAPEMYS